ncbi:Mu-like prophage protein gpG [Rodentibacter pneumotropicus]|uniref:Mu-like prophage protein gpG n=1 Tax=Rodentibacter pneumotropicus TaxID=758 RepID=A0A3S4TVT0_9PAST|nr:Mu-like prophage protein gpG [Rodentibacter pneumotropicus]
MVCLNISPLSLKATVMIEIKINNTAEVSAALERLVQATTQRTPLMRSIAGTMESAVLQILMWVVVQNG